MTLSLQDLQELHKTEKMNNFLGVVYEGSGERAGEGARTWVKHSTMKEDIGTIRRLKRRKRIVELGLFRINLILIEILKSNYSILFKNDKK